MDDATLERFKTLLDSGQDSALLRFTLGQELLRRNDPTEALIHLDAAVSQNPDYTAAWKLLGKARQAEGDDAGAGEAYRRGIEVARANGDKQLEREMQVFLRRLEG